VSAEPRLHITHVVENLNRGGLERAVIDLVAAQVARGHRCQIVCLFERGQLADEAEALGVRVLACGKRNGLDLRALLRMRRHLREQATDILHTHNAAAHYHAVLAALGLPLRRTLNTRHGMGALDTGSRREALYRRAMRRTDAVVTVCEAARHDLERSAALPGTRIVAVPNGIRIERFEAASPSARAELAATLGLAPTTPIIGTVGRLNWAKDHAGLIHAFAELRAHGVDAALALVGDGALRAELAALASTLGCADRVFLLGDRGDVAALLRGFDVFALSSLTEGYSIALLEACAAALPIVATDVGGNREIVHDGSNGWLVPARDRAVLGTRLRQMLADPLTAQGMGRAGRAWVLEEGSFTTMATRYDALYTGSDGAVR
jgi:glycosyltransferase involved in cell wall biosynthesis